VPRVTVLIPTHEHAATLPYAVASVQAQSVQDVEILICGDGVDDALRAVVAELQAGDKRIRFFDFPKGPRNGELSRHEVLQHATGEIVCYQADDDLWLPGHIAAMEQALENADFVGAMQVDVTPDGCIRAYIFDLEHAAYRVPWLDWTYNKLGIWANDGFGLCFTAHRLDAYRRLPEGWGTTAAGKPTDQTMWHKFLRQDWCRARFLRWPIALHFSAPERRDWSAAQRADELQRWTAVIAEPDYAVRIWRQFLPDLGDRLLQQALDDRRKQQDMEIEHARILAQERQQHSRLEQQVILQEQRLVLEERWRTEAERGRAEAERQLGLLRSSRSWRMTAPIRDAIKLLKRFRSPRDA
jgi:hypothetical protein